MAKLRDHLQPGGGESPVLPPEQTPVYVPGEAPLGTARKVRIVTIGAGVSGINMIRALRKHVTNYEHVVYEKNPKIGGTWFENRYPGCKCDIPSHNYQLSWKPNHGWSSFFSPAPEIEDYLYRVCAEEDMTSEIKTQHKVIKATWDESRGSWQLRIKDLRAGREFDDHAEFLLNASGVLNDWKWPDIPGLHDFSGDLIHSANWPEDFSWAGKTVALIGNGSSGIQILPAIQPDVKHLVHFVREPTWIVPPRIQTLLMGKAGNILDKIEMDADGNFTPAQIEKFRTDPSFYRTFVKAVEEEVNANFPIVLKDTEYAQLIRRTLVEYMTDALDGDEKLYKALIPDFPVGCRRLAPGDDYLKSLRSPNVTVITSPITRVTPDGVETSDGEVIKLDTIICATGFNVSFRPRFPIIGREGNLQHIWATDVPKSYMSCAVPTLPNYFTFLGPNAPVGHGSIFTIVEHVAKYIIRIILKCQTEGIKAIAPSKEAVADFYQHIETFMPRTAWASNCRSWFKDGKEDGPVVALHPGSRIHFFHMLEKFRGEDWEYVYMNASGNRFHYLGNGFSLKELDGSDSTWYLDEPDKLP
ncbi:FAD/NAD(P)-binding domain-containing protein [Hypoxylon sp. EC38]|nr:FAD/NAD(P)-binding domain-containing protein [Hypoxylon sp. EC38]